MKRRSLLKLGLAAGAVLAVAGAGVAMIRPGLIGARLSPASRELMRATAPAVLGELLPAPGAAREAALDAQLQRLDDAIAALPAAARSELSQALGLLAIAPGRLALVGLGKPWHQAAPDEVAVALEAMRLSRSTTRQQVYHALRDLNAIAFFTEPANWKSAGYPGPREI